MRRAAALLAVTALAGCSLQPPDVRPPLPVPPSWPVGDAYLRQSEAALPSVSYADMFRDPRLQALLRQALVNNRDLRVAAANIVAARAQYRIQRADLFPQVNASGRYSYSGGGRGTRTRATTGTGTGTGGVGTGTGGVGTGGNTGTGAGSGNTGTGTGAGNGADNPGGTPGGGGGDGAAAVYGTSNSSFAATLGLDAYEIDLFGRVRSLTNASLDQYFAQEAAARATRLTLIGDVASAWLTYAADKSLLQIDVETARSARESVRLTRARLEGGIAPRTDLDQAEQILRTAEADLAEQKTAIAQDANALQLLVGAPIDETLLPDSIEQVEDTLEALPAGLSSTILLRRPDVVQAEYRLRAANAQIGAARAQLFPRVTLTALAGFASTALRTLFSGGAFTYSVAPTASYPIFRAGAGRAGVTYSRAQRDAAVANYESVIQTAFREVSDALARRGTIADQLVATRRLTAAAADNARLQTARYRGGIDTYLNSLDAQRSLYNAQRTLVQTRLNAADNLVTLYRVLGGDSTLETTAGGPRLIGAPPPDTP